jgi:hypothetical protein
MKTLLSRSRGLKAGKRERVMEKKTKFCFDPIGFVVKDEDRKVKKKTFFFVFFLEGKKHI